MLGDDLEAWLAESALMKRTFRTCAIIAGLIERRFPGKEKSRREVTISTDLVYDVLRKHQGDHVLLRAARADAATGLLDIRRVGEMLSRIRGRIVHKPLDHVSPLAVPVMLEIGREMVYGEASEELLARSRGGAGEGGDAVRVCLLHPPLKGRVGSPKAIRGGVTLRGMTPTRLASLADLPLQGEVNTTSLIAGVSLVADCAGALYWPEEGLLAVADLHLEKGSSYATRGVLLPPYDTAATLARLGALDRALCPTHGGRARRQLP